MGISIQCYRARIGSFANNHKSKEYIPVRSRILKSRLRRTSSTKIILTCLQLILILSLSLTLSRQLYSSEMSSRKSNPSLSKLPVTNPSSYQPTLPLAMPPWLSAKDRNFYAKCTFGNRRQHGITILHWNKGPSFLKNKHSELETVISGHKPHIFGLSEANLWSNHDLSNIQHQDYTLHTCLTATNHNLGNLSKANHEIKKLSDI